MTWTKGIRPFNLFLTHTRQSGYVYIFIHIYMIYIHMIYVYIYTYVYMYIWITKCYNCRSVVFNTEWIIVIFKKKVKGWEKKKTDRDPDLEVSGDGLRSSVHRISDLCAGHHLVSTMYIKHTLGATQTPYVMDEASCPTSFGACPSCRRVHLFSKPADASFTNEWTNAKHKPCFATPFGTPFRRRSRALS